nr:hypothetical protein B0A51_18269 [Rachicladosporium sp. CCFEE 5018]
MFYKPFKPLSISRNTLNAAPSPLLPEERPHKKRRISKDDDDDENAEAEAVLAALQVLKAPVVKPKVKSFQPLGRTKVDASQGEERKPEGGEEGYYRVLWRKFTTKKNKTWDGDGVLSVIGGYATLQDISGREMGRTACKGPLLIGSELSVSGKEIAVDDMISKHDFMSGKIFLGTAGKADPKLKELNQVSRVSAKAQQKHDKIAATQVDQIRASVAASKGVKTGFKMPVKDKSLLVPSRDAHVPVPRHDPKGPNALIMKRPKNVPKGKQMVDVVVDPILSKHLREHQRAGVSFLYECVMGMKSYDGEGAILADEMGLGKTLQTIALLWTLLKQNPVYGDEPVIKKALIVCPVSLINNWKKEFRKWLGTERIGVFIAGDKKTRLTDFTMGKSYSVAIVGYEKLRTLSADLTKGAGIDIVIADEGHRMKTKENKAAAAIKTLNTERRVILSGTPIQNDLTEFWTMVDFVNPGLLQKYNVFKREFETPIIKSQQPGASEKDLAKGEARSEELANITSMFILRRTAEILSKYLPPKTEYVVFCRPTKAQAEVYRAIIASPTFTAALGSPAMSLELINVLKKVCNSPTLLLKKGAKGEDVTKPELLEAIPSNLLRTPGASGKLQVLDSLLHRIRTTTDEKVVLVSNYTSTLDVLQKLLDVLSYKYLRLDGQTPQKTRQELIDRFNRSPASNSFIFLLSAKAGGVGINLIGASRLVLFDLDWNPATDLQAMARIHRDGQKKPCYIYRMLTQGALDEKIFQRQVSKTGLADSIVDGKSGASGFTREELRDLFTLDESPDCQTHKLLGCACGGTGMPLAPPDHAEIENSGRNDLAALSGSSDSVQTLRMDDAEDSDEDLPPVSKLHQFKTSTSYNAEEQEAEARKAKECKDSTGKAKMLSLMQYTHFDTANISPLPTREPTPATIEVDDDGETAQDVSEFDPLEGVIEDAALRSVMREDGQRVGFVLAKVSS